MRHRMYLLAGTITAVLIWVAPAQALTVPDGKQAVGRYAAQIRHNHKPTGVQWTESWAGECWREGRRTVWCGFGLTGTRDGQNFYCSGGTEVTARRGRSRGWSTARPFRIVSTRRYRFVPDYAFDCYGDEVARIGPDGQVLDPGE